MMSEESTGALKSPALQQHDSSTPIPVLPVETIPPLTEPSSSVVPQDVQKDAHVPALDGIRGLAVLLVIAHHCIVGGRPPATIPDKILEVLAGRAWIGVDLFFVLSGFLITGILLDTRGKSGFFRSFYPRRMLRTFPLYYATLAVCFLILPWISLVGLDAMRKLSPHQGWFWLHVSNFYTTFHNILRADGPDAGWMATFWSLAVEEHFYLVWPLLVFALKPRSLAWACGILLAVVLIVRMALVTGGHSFEFIYYSTFTRLDGLFLGSWLAVLSRRKEGLAPFVRPARIVAIVSGLTLVILSATDGGRFSFFGRTFLFTLVAVCFVSLMVLVIQARPGTLLKKFFSSAVLRSCGKYSYAMYILNIPLIGLLHLCFDPDQHRILGSKVPAFLLLMATATVLTWGAAQITWHVLEKHCLKLKRYFVAGKPRPERNAAIALAAAPVEPR